MGGLLCFACGVVVMQFLALWKAEKAAKVAEDYWVDELNKLEERKSELEKDKREWEIKKTVSDLFKEATVAEPLRPANEEGGGGHHR